jgi:hypothetical protein
VINPSLRLKGDVKAAAKAIGIAKKLARQSFAGGIVSKFMNLGNTTIQVENLLKAGVSRATITSRGEALLPGVYGNATLARYAYGSGTVIGSTLTLEYGYARNQDAGLVLMNLIPYLVTGGGQVLLIENARPWSTTSNIALLTSNGISYTKTDIASAAGLTLGDYQKIILSSDQRTQFYLEYMTQKSRFDAYVQAGGILEWHAAGFGWQGGDTKTLVLPGGVTINTDQLYFNYNYNIAPSDDLLVGVPSEIYGTYASHTYLEFPSALGAEVLVVEALDK